MGKSCYIIGPIGNPGSDERAWADKVRKYIVEPAVLESGYDGPRRADDPDITPIMTDIIQQMFDADLVIADLTGNNANTFFELGIRHCAQKPVIHLMKKGQSWPFDLGDNKIIPVSTDIDDVQQAKADIKARLQAIEKNPDLFHSQVHVHIKLRQFDMFQKSDAIDSHQVVETFKTILASHKLMSDILIELKNELLIKPMTTRTLYGFPYYSSLPNVISLSPYESALRNLASFTPSGVFPQYSPDAQPVRGVPESKEDKGETKE